MENQVKYPIKVRLRIGMLKKNINRPMPATDTCKNCHQTIYWIRIMGKKCKVQADHVKDNEFIDHALVCPTVLAYEEKKRYAALRMKKKK